MRTSQERVSLAPAPRERVSLVPASRERASETEREWAR
jgi:hypothetical protein